MPIDFTCPHCGTRTNVDDRYAGQSGPCAKCDRTITIPAMGQMAGPVPGQKGSGSPCLVVTTVIAVLVGLLLCGGVLSALFLPAIKMARIRARQVACASNLRQINLAVLNYASEHGSFPPAYTVGARGQRLHSWRVLILPYLGREDLYRQIHFDEPWNSEHNQKLANAIPEVFRCPTARLWPHETSYVVVVGERTMFPFDKGRRPSEVTDGVAKTILVVEQFPGVNWMEPRDLDFKLMSFRINDPDKACIGSNKPDGANVAFADGNTQFFSDSLSPQVVEQMLLIDDGKPYGAP